MFNQSSWQTRKQQAILLARANRLDDALPLCLELHRQLPHDTDVINALAVVCARRGDFERAESYARMLVALQPDAAASHATLANALQGLGKANEAEACLRTALVLNPQQAPVWLQLGNMLAARGAEDEAGSCLEKAVALDPGNAQAQHNLGVWLQSAGRIKEAVEHYRRAVALQPDSTYLLHSLGCALYADHSREAAADCFGQVLRAEPVHRQALLNLANVNFDSGEFARAAISYHQLLELEPGHVEAQLGLGLAYQHLGRPRDALAYFRRLTELEPNAAEHCQRLGHLCLELGRPDEALVAFRRAHSLAPKDPRPALYAGIALQQLGKLEDALDHYEQLERDGLANPTDLVGLRAGVYEKLGRYNQAWETIKARLAQGGVSPRVAEVASRVCISVGECGRVVQLLNDLLSDERLATADRRSLYFALGSLQDKLQNYDAAFEAYLAGNALKNLSYSEARDAAFVDAMTSVFTSDRYRAMQPTSGKGAMPVFIVGMPRSGSSLIEQILCSHPLVFGAGESLAMGKLVERLGDITGTGQAFPVAVLHLDAAALSGMADQYLAELTIGAQGAVRITDKMPHNFVYLGLIRLMFPEARIIHSVRDPVDTCLSCFFQDFSGFHNYAYDLSHLGSHYLQYRKIMRLWKEALEVPMFEVHYESLVDNPEEEVRRLLDYCGLAWDECCLQFHESGRNIRTASYDQVRKPLYKTSRGRWRNYRQHLGPLLEKLGVPDNQTSPS
jgi:tetratricopeptide (TPR) repeat protein